MSFKYWIIVVSALFVIGIVWGLSVPESSAGTFSTETTALEKFALFLGSLPPGIMFVLIFLKNAAAVLFSFIASPFFLLVPIFSLVLNGWLIGLVARRVVAEQSIGYLLGGLLPHGIFEIPALIIGEAAALGFGVALMQAAVSRRKRENLPSGLKPYLKYLVISLTLLLPAALMETFVTPLLLD